jgi:hypothetical protein
MTTRDTGKTIQVVVRLDYDLVARLDAIGEKLSRPGLAPTRTDVVRTVLLAGLPVVEEREGIAKRRK